MGIPFMKVLESRPGVASTVCDKTVELSLVVGVAGTLLHMVLHILITREGFSTVKASPTRDCLGVQGLVLLQGVLMLELPITDIISILENCATHLYMSPQPCIGCILLVAGITLESGLSVLSHMYEQPASVVELVRTQFALYLSSLYRGHIKWDTMSVPWS